jgi:histone deacetylase 1/2
VDTCATDHLTSDLERLHVHERYGGKDQVQLANGSGLSISHIGHSTLAGSSLHLKDILHVPHIQKNLLCVYRLVFDNDVFVEFHHHFFCVKDKATKKVILHGRSHGGLYPIRFNKAPPSSSRQASVSVKVSPSQWHQCLGHPSNNVVHTIVKTHELSCSSDNSSLVCDACQHAKSHQLPYTASSRVSTVPLELIHSDVWGPARVSSGGTNIMLVLWMIILVSAGYIFLNISLMLNRSSTLSRLMLSIF